METISNLQKVLTVEEIFNKVSAGDAKCNCIRMCVTEKQMQGLATAMAGRGVEFNGVKPYAIKSSEEKAEKMQKLVIAGYSEIAMLYDVEIQWRGTCIEYFGCGSVTPYLVINNKAYYINVPCYGKAPAGYSLSLLHETSIFSKIDYNSGFLFDEKTPNKVGVATVKKLQAWVDWLERREQAASNFLNDGANKKTELFNRLESYGLEYKVNGNKVTIYNGFLRMNVEISQSGIYMSSPEIDFLRYYDAKKKFADELDFMANLKINN